MKMTIFCNHYRAMSPHKTCNAGIAYDTLAGHGQPGFFDKCPCFWRRGKGDAKQLGCSLAEFPTEEQIKQDEAESTKHMEAIGKARQAIVAHLGGPWKRGTAGATGTIDCPACGGKATLRFSRAGYNGHIHAGCATKDCVGWME